MAYQKKTSHTDGSIHTDGSYYTEEMEGTAPPETSEWTVEEPKVGNWTEETPLGE